MVLGLWFEEGSENEVDFGDPPFVRFVVEIVVGQETGQFVFGVELGEVHWVQVLCEVVLILGIRIAFGCKEVLDFLGQGSCRFFFSYCIFKFFRRTAITVSHQYNVLGVYLLSDGLGSVLGVFLLPDGLGSVLIFQVHIWMNAIIVLQAVLVLFL